MLLHCFHHICASSMLLHCFHYICASRILLGLPKQTCGRVVRVPYPTHPKRHTAYFCIIWLPTTIHRGYKDMQYCQRCVYHRLSMALRAFPLVGSHDRSDLRIDKNSYQRYRLEAIDHMTDVRKGQMDDYICCLMCRVVYLMFSSRFRKQFSRERTNGAKQLSTF